MNAPSGKIKIALLLSQGMFNGTFARDAQEKLFSFAEATNAEPLPEAVGEDYILRNIAGAEAAVTCWGTPKITGPLLAAATDLKLIAHGAGTPRAIVDSDIWARGGASDYRRACDCGGRGRNGAMGHHRPAKAHEGI